ncbi:MAG: hypothetical protein ACUVXI_12260 [bacterium]
MRSGKPISLCVVASIAILMLFLCGFTAEKITPVAGKLPDVQDDSLSISPSGDEILFAAKTEDLSSHIFKIRLKDGKITQLTSGKDLNFNPTWSHDGKRIAYYSQIHGVFVMDREGGGRRRISPLLGAARNLYPQWSRDDSKILFASNSTPEGEIKDYDIYLVDVDNPEETRKLADSRWSEYNPTWSPDGEKIAYLKAVSGKRDIHIMRADGSEDRPLTKGLNGDGPIKWSPNGLGLLASITHGGKRILYYIEVPSGDLRRLTQEDEVTAFQWSPRGEAMFSSTLNDRSAIHAFDPETGEPPKIILKGGSNPIWWPDGEGMFYTSREGGKTTLYNAELKRPLPPPPKEAIVKPTASTSNSGPPHLLGRIGEMGRLGKEEIKAMLGIAVNFAGGGINISPIDIAEMILIAFLLVAILIVSRRRGRTGLRKLEQYIERLKQDFDEVAQSGVRTLEDKVEYVQDVLNAVDTKISKLESIARDREIYSKFDENELSDLIDKKIVILNTLVEHIEKNISRISQDSEMINKTNKMMRQLTDIIKDMDAKIGKISKEERTLRRSEDRVRELKQSIKEVDDKIKEIKDERKALLEADAKVEQISMIIDKVGENERIINELDARIIGFRKILEEVQNRSQAILGNNAHLEEIRARLQEAGDMVNQIEGKLNELTERLKKMNEVEKQIEDLDSSIITVIKKVEGVLQERKLIDGISKRLDLLERVAGNGEIDRILEEIDSRIQKIEEKEEYLKSVESKIDGLREIEADFEEKARNIKEVGGLLGETAKEVEKLKGNVNHMKYLVKRITRDGKIVEEMEARLDGLRNIAQEIDERMKESRDIYKMIEAIGGRVDALNSLGDTIESRIASLNEKRKGVEEAEERIAGFVKGISSMEGKIDSLMERLKDVDELQERLESLKAIRTEITARLSTAAEEKERLRGLEEKIEEMKVREGEAEAHLKTLSRMEARAEELGNSIAQARENLERLNSEVREIEGIKTNMEEIRRFAEGLNAQMSILMAKKDDIITWGNSIRDIEGKLGRMAQKQGELVGGLQKVEEAAKRMDELEAFISFADEKLESLENRRKLIDEANRKIQETEVLWRDLDRAIKELKGQSEIVEDIREKIEKVGSLAEYVDLKMESLEKKREVIDEISSKVNILSARVEDIMRDSSPSQI